MVDSSYRVAEVSPCFFWGVGTRESSLRHALSDGNCPLWLPPVIIPSLNYAPIIGCSNHPRSWPIRAISVSRRTFSLTVQVTKYRRSYQLNVVQHPQKAAEFGYESLSRFSLTPPMVVQLTVRDMSSNSIVPYVCSSSCQKMLINLSKPRRAAFPYCASVTVH